MTANEYRVSLWGDKNNLKLMVVMDAQLREYTKNHWIVFSKQRNIFLTCRQSHHVPPLLRTLSGSKSSQSQGPFDDLLGSPVTHLTFSYSPALLHSTGATVASSMPCAFPLQSLCPCCSPCLEHSLITYPMAQTSVPSGLDSNVTFPGRPPWPCQLI